MSSRFAYIEYIDTCGGIPAPPKTDRFAMEPVTLLGEYGFRVRLPLSESEAKADAALAGSLYNSILEMLPDYNVDIVIPPSSIPFSCSNKITVADGSALFPFFLDKSIKKALKSPKRGVYHSISLLEVLVSGYIPIVWECVIDCLINSVNFLTVCVSDAVCGDVLERLYTKTDEVFYETGVRIGVLKTGAEAFRNADVIINLQSEKPGYENCFAENAVYVDLSRNETWLYNIVRRRKDLVAADGVKLKYMNKIMTLPAFEVFFFLKSRDYRRFRLSPGYDRDAAERAKKTLDELNIRVAALCLFGKPADSQQ